MKDIHPEADKVSIIVLAMEGDDSAYEELVRRFQPFIRNLMKRLCRYRETADDLAQQVFFQAWRKLPGLKEPAAFPGWLRSIAINEWLQFLRRKHIETRAMDENTADIDGKSSHIDQRIDLDDALSQLSPIERLCIVLAYSEGMSHGEIAVATAWPLGTIKSHIARGSARLREILSSYR
jgi:RNA polymerase sigma factor (sigma-70 family)